MRSNQVQPSLCCKPRALLRARTCTGPVRNNAVNKMNGESYLATPYRNLLNRGTAQPTHPRTAHTHTHTHRNVCQMYSLNMSSSLVTIQWSSSHLVLYHRASIISQALNRLEEADFTLVTRMLYHQVQCNVGSCSTHSSTNEA